MVDPQVHPRLQPNRIRLLDDDIERRQDGDTRSAMGQALGELEVRLTEGDRGVDVGLGDFEKRTRLEDLSHVQDDAHRQRGGWAAIALQ